MQHVTFIHQYKNIMPMHVTGHKCSSPCAITFSWWGDCVPQWPR